MKIAKQYDVNECGLLLLQGIFKNLFKKNISINFIKSQANYNDKGISIANLISLGKKLNIKLKAFEGSFQIAKDKFLNKEFITILKKDNVFHYALIKITKRKVIITDSINGKWKEKYYEFKKQFQNLIITFEKNIKSEIKKVTIPKKIFYLTSKFSGLKVIILLSVLINLFFLFSSSVFLKIVIDKIIPGKLEKTLLIIFIGFIWLSFLNALNFFTKKYFLKKLNLNIEWNLKNIFLEKIKKIHCLELLKITKNDIIRRFLLIGALSSYLSEYIITIINQTLILITSTILLIIINPFLYILVFVSVVFIFLITLWIYFNISSKIEFLQKKELNHLTTSFDLVKIAEGLKISNNFSFLKKIFSKNLIEYKRTEFWIWKQSAIQSFIIYFIKLVIPLVIIYFGTKTIFKNQISLGSLLMFVSFFNFSLNPSENLAALLIQNKQNKKYLELFEFFLFLKNEKNLNEGLTLNKIDSLEIKKLHFGYDKLLFKIHHFETKENLHIYGENGSGKTTLLKIISTIFLKENNLSFNKINLSMLNLKKTREKIFYASSDQIFPEVTIYEYITLNDFDAKKLLNKNIEKYNLASLIQKMKIDFNLKLKNNGTNISSGQRQFIHLLKLFAFKYDLIIIDEGTENINKNIIKNISKKILQNQQSIFFEVSHSKKYISKGKEISIEKIISNPY